MSTNANIQVDELILGRNVVIEPSASIRGINGNAKKIVIGDNTYIGADVQIIVNELQIGDYCKIHHHTNIHGNEMCNIGHNAWIGQYCLIDCIGGVKIGNNFCLGIQSHVWSHIKFGDTLAGCRFSKFFKTTIGNDVWIAGNCSIAPTTIADKAMVLANSAITKPLEFNQIYAGNPAKNISEKIGSQFDKVATEEKIKVLTEHLRNSGIDSNKIKIVAKATDFGNENASYFAVEDRVYTKKHLPEEIAFIRYLLPEKGKFVPV